MSWLFHKSITHNDLRPATPADVPFIQEVEAYAARRYLVRCVRDAALWRYEVEGRTSGGAETMQVCVIASAAGEPVGYLVHPEVLWGDALSLWVYELRPGASWWKVTPCVMRYLKAKRDKMGHLLGLTCDDL